MQLIIIPLTLVRDLVIGIIQSPTSLHLVSYPLPGVLASVWVVEHSIAMTHVVQFVALVDTTFELLAYVMGFGVVGVDWGLGEAGLWDIGVFWWLFLLWNEGFAKRDVLEWVDLVQHFA